MSVVQLRAIATAARTASEHIEAGVVSTNEALVALLPSSVNGRWAKAAAKPLDAETAAAAIGHIDKAIASVTDARRAIRELGPARWLGDAASSHIEHLEAAKLRLAAGAETSQRDIETTVQLLSRVDGTLDEGGRWLGELARSVDLVSSPKVFFAHATTRDRMTPATLGELDASSARTIASFEEFGI